jgi:hypothetical protein
MTEDEYNRQFTAMQGEVTAATNAFYTYVEIHKFASETQQNYEKINRDANFWNILLYGLQTTWFIALGRIFDRSSGAYSIKDFLAATVAHKGLFSKRALADRKRNAVRGEPCWLDDYLKTAWEPSTPDLEGIAAAIKPAEAKYAERYKAIRDKVFAHRDPSKLAATLFENTLVSDIEDILFTLNEAMLAIFQLLENGSRYPIGTGNRRYADRVVADTRRALVRDLSRDPEQRALTKER